MYKGVGFADFTHIFLKISLLKLNNYGLKCGFTGPNHRKSHLDPSVLLLKFPESLHIIQFRIPTLFKETKSATMNNFRFFFYFLFKSFVKVELSYVFTINLFTLAENCTEK